MSRHSFALLAYAFAAIMLGTTLPTPMYALYGERMHFAVFTTTVIYATYAGGVLFALLVFGRWSDAVGRRPMLSAGVGCALASAVVFLTADTVAQLLVGRVLSGLSAGIFTGTATAAVIEAAPPSWRNRAAAVATVANIGGLGAGPLVAGMVILTVALHFSSLFGLVAAAVVGGAGQGISFSRGLAAVLQRTPAERHAEVSSTYFVVAYVAISLPVMGVGLAARDWGLRPAGVGFAIAVAVLATVCFLAVLAQEARESRRSTTALSRSCDGTPGDSPRDRAPGAS